MERGGRSRWRRIPARSARISACRSRPEYWRQSVHDSPLLLGRSCMGQPGYGRQSGSDELGPAALLITPREDAAAISGSSRLWGAMMHSIEGRSLRIAILTPWFLVNGGGTK